MNIKSIILLTGLVTLCSAVGAQPKLYVRDFTDAQTVYALGTIRSVTFVPGNMFVRKTSGLSDQYSFDAVRYLSFADFTTDTRPVEVSGVNVALSPNPAKDRLALRAEGFTSGMVELQICTLQGQIMCRQQHTSAELGSGISVDVQPYPAGIYICRMRGNYSTTSAKFVKY